MKKSIFIIIFLFCIAQSWGQRSGLKPNFKDKENAYKINLLSPIRSTINLSWHHLLTPNSGVQVTLAYMDFDSYGDQIDKGYNTASIGGSLVYTYSDIINQQTRGFAIMPEYRYMLNGRGLSGFYAGPFLRYAYCNYNYDELTTVSNGSSWFSSRTSFFETNKQINYHSAGIGLVIGKQYLFKNTCVIDFFGGPVYSFLLHASNGATQTNDIQIGSRLPRSYLNGYGIRLGVTFGIVR